MVVAAIQKATLGYRGSSSLHTEALWITAMSFNINSQIQEESVLLCVSVVAVAGRGSHVVKVSHLWGGWTDTPMMLSG